mmetsp:Transcript_16624/g.35118  ORF Transcript_16624/g.35118 Transcript_16624/m.35118 type:complete len:158 (-) Transcript_16624:80-553(-)
MVLENSGVRFGVHDTRAGQRTREEYHQLLTSHVGDTRSRITGAGNNESTFNVRTRALSFGASGRCPKSEYSATSMPALDASQAETGWPASVTGGHIIPFQGSQVASERHRRAGSLGRNIVGNCTVKDDRFVYYGSQGSSHYGMNSNTRNMSHYKVLQ